MPPDVGEINAPLAYSLRLMHRVAILKKVADKTFGKAHGRYKEDYDNMFGSSHALQWVTTLSLNVPH